MTAGRLRLIVGVAALTVLGAVGFFSFRGAGEDEAAPTTVDVTEPEAFDLPALEGDGRVRLADFKGTPLVVNFFASWCGPCEKELPHFADAASKLKGKVRFIALNSMETRSDAAVEMARRHGLEEAGITVGRDVGGRANSQLHDRLALGRGMPINAFYDANGTLLDVGRGALLGNKLANSLHNMYGVTYESSG
ncbi:MAG: TlpA disulfide reductase family protein [Acidimicrobiia bacterium]